MQTDRCTPPFIRRTSARRVQGAPLTRAPLTRDGVHHVCTSTQPITTPSSRKMWSTRWRWQWLRPPETGLGMSPQMRASPMAQARARVRAQVRAPMARSPLSCVPDGVGTWPPRNGIASSPVRTRESGPAIGERWQSTDSSFRCCII